MPGTRRRASSAARRPSSRKLGGRRTSTTATSGRSPRDRVDEGVAVLDGGDHLHPAVAEQADDAVAQQREVLGDHDPHGSSAVRIVPPARGAVDG